MAITRTAKGTAQSKASSTTLTISSVSLTASDLLVVGIAYETDAAIDSVKWGSRALTWVRDSGNTQGDTRVRIYRARVRDTATRDIVATWAANMSARAMFATAFTEVAMKDAVSTAGFGAGTTAPNTGTAVQSTVADTVSVAAFASLGPSGDTAGTAGDGHTLGQRVGTTGGGAATNVTIQETYEILSATGDVRASLSGATGRPWACSIVAFQQGLERLKVNTGAGNITLDDGDLDAVHDELVDVINANFTQLEGALPLEAQTNYSNQQKMDSIIVAAVRFPTPVKT